MSEKKRGKVLGKRQVLVSVMALALGLAVWLNMKYASDSSGFKTAANSSALGEAQFVSEEGSAIAVETAAGEDYFAKTRSEREDTRNEAIDTLKDTAKSAKGGEDEKTAATEQLAIITKRMEDEAAIETLVKAKGFKDAVAVIGDNGISVIVKSDKLLQSETLQIQDIVTSQTGENLEKIKIIAVK